MKYCAYRLIGLKILLSIADCPIHSFPPIKMNPIVKILLTLSAIIGIVVSSPVEFKPFDTEIAPAAAEDVNYRLNRDVLPLRYDLKLTPYFKNVSLLLYSHFWI